MLKNNWIFTGDASIKNGIVSVCGHKKYGSVQSNITFDTSKKFIFESEIFFSNGHNEKSAIIDIDCPVNKNYISICVTEGLYKEYYIVSSVLIDGNLNSIQSDFNYLDKKWHKLSISYSENIMDIYMDENKISTMKNPGKFDSQAYLSFGHNELKGVEIDPNNRIFYKNIKFNDKHLFRDWIYE